MKERRERLAGAVGGGVPAAVAFFEEWSVHPHATTTHGPITGLAVLLGGFIGGGAAGWFLAAVTAKSAAWTVATLSILGLLITAANGGFNGHHLGTEVLAYLIGVGSLVVSSLARGWWPLVDELWNGHGRAPLEQPPDHVRAPHPAEIAGTSLAAPPTPTRQPRFTASPGWKLRSTPNPGDTRPD